MQVLVTGADGFLGSNTVRRLIAAGHRVRGLVEPHSSASTLDGLEIETVSGDITISDDVRRAVRGCDAIVHAAGSTRTWPNRCETVRRINVEGTREVVEAALDHGVKRLVYISSASVFRGGTRAAPGDETRFVPAHEHSLGYIATKAEAHSVVEDAAERRGLPATIIAPTFMFGPFDVKPSSGQALLAIYHGVLPGLPPGGRNFVSVEDVADAILRALERDESGEAFIAGGTNLSYPELCEIVASMAPVRLHVPRVYPRVAIRLLGVLGSVGAAVTRRPPKLTVALADLACRDQFYTNAKARRRLGFEPRPIEKAVRDALAWFAEQGYMKR